jgi:hypothetical protein
MNNKQPINVLTNNDEKLQPTTIPRVPSPTHHKECEKLCLIEEEEEDKTQSR